LILPDQISFFFAWRQVLSKRIGTVSIIVTDRMAQAARVNDLLTEYGKIIIGRMGLPYTPKGIHIISLIVHGSTDEIGALTGKLGLLEGVEVKSALTKV
jgi:putative iron-only hydrogenase system regulator